MDQTVNLDFLIKLVQKYWRAILFCTLGGIVIATGITYTVMQPQYKSSVQILVSRHSNNAATQYTNQQADVQMITTYKELIMNQVILNPVVEHLAEEYDYTYTLDKLQKAITISNTQNSQVFSINVTDPNRVHSARIANQIAKDFKVQVKEIIKVNNITIVAPATPSKLPISPKKVLNIMIGLVVGMAVGLLYAMIRTVTDRRVQGLDFLTGELALPILGQVNHQHQFRAQHMQQQVQTVNQNDTNFETNEDEQATVQRRV